MPQPALSSTTQQYLDIYDITNNLVLMKNGVAAVIISVDAMNFSLLAEEEQDGIIYSYAGLINSINYPIQIVVRSQTKDVTSYLRVIKDREDVATDRTQQQRIRRYREFVTDLIRERNVLDKKFYVAVPASAIELGLLSVGSVVPGNQAFDVASVEKSVLIEKALNILEPKRDHLISQFARIGLYSYQLNTQEIIQLFYTSYNPEASDGQRIADSNNYTTPLVKASYEGSPMFFSQDDTQTNQVGQVGQAGQVNQADQVNQVDQVAQTDQVGQVNQVNQVEQQPQQYEQVVIQPESQQQMQVPGEMQAPTPAPTPTPAPMQAPESAPTDQLTQEPQPEQVAQAPEPQLPDSALDLDALQNEINQTVVEIDPDAQVVASQPLVEAPMSPDMPPTPQMAPTPQPVPQPVPQPAPQAMPQPVPQPMPQPQPAPMPQQVQTSPQQVPQEQQT